MSKLRRNRSRAGSASPVAGQCFGLGLLLDLQVVAGAGKASAAAVLAAFCLTFYLIDTVHTHCAPGIDVYWPAIQISMRPRARLFRLNLSTHRMMDILPGHEWSGGFSQRVGQSSAGSWLGGCRYVRAYRRRCRGNRSHGTDRDRFTFDGALNAGLTAEMTEGCPERNRLQVERNLMAWLEIRGQVDDEGNPHGFLRRR